MNKPIGEITLNTLFDRYPLLPELPQYHGKWSYDIGVVLQGVKLAYQQTNDRQYLDYIKATMALYIQADGSIRNYEYEHFNLDSINNGKSALFLFEQTGDQKYKLACDQLYQQLQNMPRTTDGGFWHKQIYPQQMWLDGLYMAEPFYAEYILKFRPRSEMADVVQQFTLAYQHTLDEKTGLLYHAWNEDRRQPWADPKTGHSPHFWGRAIGWYLMGLVDTYEIIRDEFPKEAQQLQAIFLKTMVPLRSYRSGIYRAWYQVVDAGERHGNYLEASASAMIVYAMEKAARLSVLMPDWQVFIKDSYQGLLDNFVFYTKEGWLNLVRNCQVAGLGGADQRDGSFVYYISEPIITNDFKGYGAFLLAALEADPLVSRI